MVEKHPQSLPDRSQASGTGNAERLVLVMPQEPIDDNQISLIELWTILWQGKWLILTITTIFTLLSVSYALTATEWYRSSVLLAPVKSQSTGSLAGELGGLGGLAGLAGINLGDNNTAEPIAVLKSRDFTRAFINDKNLLTVLLADEWDAEAGRWIAEDPSDQPDIRDAVKFFDEHVRRVSVDSDTSLVTLSIEWTDPAVSAEWADVLVARLNDNMRQRALAEAEYNVVYLEEELADTNVASLRQSISNILETELQKLMLAKGSEEFAFRIIDGAQVPKEHEKPKRFVIVVVATMLGGTFAVFFVFIRHAFKHSNSANTTNGGAVDA